MSALTTKAVGSRLGHRSSALSVIVIERASSSYLSLLLYITLYPIHAHTCSPHQYWRCPSAGNRRGGRGLQPQRPRAVAAVVVAAACCYARHCCS